MTADVADNVGMETYWHTFDSPIGRVLLVGRSDKLTGLYLDRDPNPAWDEDEERLAKVRLQVEEYFDGTRTSFGDVELAPQGTPFQLAVWEALLEIGYGETASYADIARRIGKPTAFRAVGAANGRNPISIIVPCHRVIGANGTLTGYGGGLNRKRWLLDLERGGELFD
jgi:methylated-DNA-[protein]-cysteine S-methyltransferase